MKAEELTQSEKIQAIAFRAYQEIAEMMSELDAAQESEDEDAIESAQERIQNDPLSISVRSGWESLYEELTPSEYRILLSTGGPATQIVGDLNDHGEPETATLQAQDWFTPWADFYSDSEQEAVLLSYAQFIFPS